MLQTFFTHVRRSFSAPMHNNPSAKTRCQMSGIFKFLLSEQWGDWPQWIENTKTPSLSEGSITFVNHATFLIQMHGINILVDPVFSKAAGPFGVFGPKRRRASGLDLKGLPPIDLVLVTHNHYDHLDMPTLKQLNALHDPEFLVPTGDRELLEAAGIKKAFELGWWDSHPHKNLTLHFTPAKHFSGRTPFDGGKSLWGGFLIESKDINLFHAGDTAYDSHFKEIGQRFTIDVALLPMGDYKPQWFLSDVHMGPEEALKAHKDLGSPLSFGMHCETFRLSGMAYREASKTLKKLLPSTPYRGTNFKTLEVGETFMLKGNTQHP